VDWYGNSAWIDASAAYNGGSDGHPPPAPKFIGSDDGSTDLTSNACVYGSGTSPRRPSTGVNP